MIRKAKEAARDRMRSVNAVRHHHNHGPHPAKPSRRSQPQSRGFSSVSLKQVDDAFNAALDDESDFSNPFCDSEPPPALPTVVENKQLPSSDDYDNEDLFSDPPTTRVSGDNLFDSDPLPPATTSNIDPLMEQSVVDPSRDKGDPLMEQSTVDPLWDKGENEATRSEPNDLLEDTSHDVDDDDVSNDTGNKTETVTQELLQDTQVPEHDQLVPLVPNDNNEPAVETSLPSVVHDKDSLVDSHEDEFSSQETPPVETVLEGEQHQTTTTTASDNHLLLDEHSDDLFSDDYIIEAGNDLSDREDHIIINKPHEDLPSNIYPPLPSVDDLKQGLAVPRSDHHDFLFEESPLSSLPSSFENEHMLASYDSEHVESTAEKSVGKIKQEESLNESTGSIEADLDMLLASKSSKASNEEKQRPKPSTSRASRERDGQPHLDSGVFEHETGMTTTPERDCKDDSLLMSEDHFASSKGNPPMKQESWNTRRTETHSTTYSPPKRNSLGKVTPPRPPISPKIQKRLSKAKEATAGGTGGVKVKIVQPLGSAPPEHMSTSLSSRMSNGGTKQAHTVEVDLKGNRIAADNLFTDDTSSLDVEIKEHNDKKTDEVLSQPDTQTQSEEMSESHYLPLWVHLTLAGCLYLYYSLNIFPYLAGFFAGFLMVYFLVGSVFIYYVQTEEKARAKDSKLKEAVELSDEFVKHMNVKFEQLKSYEGRKFTGTLSYDPATHHPSQRQRTTLKLRSDFNLLIHVYDPAHGDTIKKTVNIRNCKITLVPQEVAKNRKRRWSKKFPIHISNDKIQLSVFVFSPHARDKEDWFRRMKSASLGFTSEQIIKERKDFFKYMQHYFQLDALYEASPPVHAAPRKRSKRSPHSSTSSAYPQRKPERVQFSKAGDSIDEEDPESNPISITKGSPQLQHRTEGYNRSSRKQLLTSSSSSGSLQAGTSVEPPRSSSATPLVTDDFEVIPRPQLRLPRATMWINAMAARLCWDMWHEKRWKDWVMTRIQKKLIRVKTPSFIDQLRLTDVNLGKDMPVVKGLHHGPILDLRGIWVFLNVIYEGRFVMTIETKMKLGAKDEGKEEGAQQMTENSKQKDDSKLPMSSPHQLSSSAVKLETLSHSNAAKALGSSEEIDSGSDEEDSHSSGAVHPLERSTTESHKTDTNDVAVSQTSSSSGKEGRFKSMYSFAKAGATKITKRVANTKFVRKAAEKVSSYPLTLTVDVRRLEGVLAVNVPPPPTDTIWYGFQKSPKLDLVAKPKLGHREVTYSRVTHWIEKKLCELVDKKLVLPEMEDLVIPILNSGMPGLDVLKPIGTDSETTNS